jgi:short-chain 2-methylacyl-CoA dehydrogenase
MARLGLFALPFPETEGGAGGDFLSYCLALEEIARADASVAITLEAAVSLGITPILRFGTSEQKQRWLPELLSGERLWAFGLTEPEAGSDAGGTQTRADRSGDD